MRRSRNGTEWGMPRSDELGSVSFKPVGGMRGSVCCTLQVYQDE